MGIYTKFEFDATLRLDVPKPLLDFIKYRLTRTDNHDEFNRDIPFDDHPFFKCERWDWILTWHVCNGNESVGYCEDRPEGLFIHIDTSLKNYCSSIEWFLLWIAPLVNLDYECTKLEEIDGHYDAETEDCSELIRKIQDKIKLDPNNYYQMVE